MKTASIWDTRCAETWHRFWVLRDVLLARLGERAVDIDDPALEEKLEALVARCETQMPNVVVDRAAFIIRIGDALLSREGALQLATLDRLAIEDLYLATALAAGDRAALALAERDLVPIMRQAAGKIDADRSVMDEVIQRIRHRLFVGEPGSEPAINSYRGTGPLTRWLRVVATRTAVDLTRAREHVDGDEAIAELVAPDDPELALIWHTCADAYKRALAHAVKLLPKRDRTLLRQRYVDGLELDALGKIHGVHASTVMRRLRKIEDELATTTRAALKSELALSDSQLSSMERMVVGQLPLSLTRMLRAGR